MRVLDLELVPVIDRALAGEAGDGALELHYQPEIDLASGAVVGMEALVRWRGTVRGLVQPADFLPGAIGAAMGARLDTWVLDRAVEERHAWLAAVPPTPDGEERTLWVNIGPEQLFAPGFSDGVAARVAAAQLPVRALGIEVTEAALNRDERLAAEVLSGLRAAGVALAIDDFGTWYSTLATLGELPIDAVKLDRRFVRGVGADVDDDSIVGAVVRLAHSRGLRVVAEGVESWAESARLCELGCDRALGFLFAPPQPAEMARRTLLRGWGWSRPSVLPEPRLRD